VTAPWHGIVPEADLAACGLGPDAAPRQPSVGRRPGLLVVDMTEAFLEERYATAAGPTGWDAVAATRKLLDAARAAGAPVYFTIGYHGELPPPVRGRWRSGAGTAAAVPGAAANRVVDALAPQPGELVVDKQGRPSAFFGTPLAPILVHDGVDTLVVAGVTTSGCVRATVVDAFQNNFHVLVAYECTADRSAISHAVSLFDIHTRYGDVVDLAAARSALAGAREAVPANRGV
jgi:maleamate amidohydrolase